MTTRTSAIILAAALAAVGARAETLDETDVRTAAVAFVNRDEIGASVLAGRQVASVASLASLASSALNSSSSSLTVADRRAVRWAESNDSNRAGLRFFRVRVEPK